MTTQERLAREIRTVESCGGDVDALASVIENVRDFATNIRDGQNYSANAHSLVDDLLGLLPASTPNPTTSPVEEEEE